MMVVFLFARLIGERLAVSLVLCLAPLKRIHPLAWHRRMRQVIWEAGELAGFVVAGKDIGIFVLTFSLAGRGLTSLQARLRLAIAASLLGHKFFLALDLLLLLLVLVAQLGAVQPN